MEHVSFHNKSDTFNNVFRDGYVFPVYGIANGSFIYVHVSAITFIIVSLICAVIAITLSFRNRTYTNFFTRWTKADRLVVYMSVYDGCFNLSHLFDHVHMVVTRDHVRPKALCAFYGFNLVLFVTAQILLVNIVAVNAFMMMFFNKNMSFGKRDWKLFIWTFLTPLTAAIIAASLNQFGPNGVA